MKFIEKNLYLEISIAMSFSGSETGSIQFGFRSLV